MSKTIRYKLTEAQHATILGAANQMGISVEVLARQALFLVIQQAQELHEKVIAGRDPDLPSAKNIAAVKEAVGTWGGLGKDGAIVDTRTGEHISLSEDEYNHLMGKVTTIPLTPAPLTEEMLMAGAEAMKDQHGKEGV